MPPICAFYGILIRMFFNDHPPPHFHARYGDSAMMCGHAFFLCLDGLPSARQCPERLLIRRPVVEGSRVEIRSVRPHNCLHFRINSHLIEDLQVAQWAVKFARKNRPKVDCLRRAVVKTNSENVRSNDLKSSNSMDWMTHKCLFQWLNRCGALPLLQSLPIS